MTGFFCPRTRGGTQSWDPGTLSCVEATECSIDPVELPPGIAIGRSAPPPYPPSALTCVLPSAGLAPTICLEILAPVLSSLNGNTPLFFLPMADETD